jgi:hypothetical protein
MNHLACSEVICRCCKERTCRTSPFLASLAIKLFQMQSSALGKEQSPARLGDSPPASAILKEPPKTAIRVVCPNNLEQDPNRLQTGYKQAGLFVDAKRF